MQKILRKRVWRDLKENVLRYLALGFMIILGMYLIISMVGAADTIIVGVDKVAEQAKVEDGQFGVFAPLTKQQRKELTDKGIDLEEMFYLDFQTEKESTLRVFKNRERIDLLQLEEGTSPETEKEIVLEKRYCEEHDIQTGNVVSVGKQEFTVCGIGTVPDYDAAYRNLSDSSVDSGQFGIAFVTEEAYDSLNASATSDKAEEYLYAYRLNGKMTDTELKEELKELKVSEDEIEDVYFKEYWKENIGEKEDLEEGIQELSDGSKEISDALNAVETFTGNLQDATGQMLHASLQEISQGSEKLSEGIGELKEQSDELIDKYFDIEISNLTHFLTAEDNPRIKASANDQVLTKVVGLMAGVIVMILFTYVISVFVIHGIEKESSIIGALYALGAKRKDLIYHYLMLPVIVTFISGVIGTALGYSKWGIDVQMADCYGYFSIPTLETVYAPYLLAYGIVMPPVIAVLVNYLTIRKRLSQPVLKLIKNEKKAHKISNINLGKMGFVGRFRIRQMLREMRTSFTVVFGMFISLLILMLGVDCYVLVNHISEESKADTKFEYMYTYKYPEKEVPEGGEAGVAKTFKKEIFGYNLDVTLLGIDDDNPYFDAKVSKGQNQIVISSAMAQKYQLKEGEQVILTDEETDRYYAFEVKGITQYSVGMYAFMDIDSMRELFGEEEDYYNVVFADSELDIDSGRLYATTTRDEIMKGSDVFISMMMPMIYMLTVVSIIIFCIVMYLMMKVMIDRSAFGISLIKVFGYRKNEIRKLYLSGNFYIIAIGAAVCIPVTKWIMDMLYPFMISNVSCGMNLTFTWQLYVGIYLAILVLYFVINQILVQRLNKVVPAEVLKNRE